MGDQTGIEWTDATWNVLRGCTRVSPGCGGPGPHGGCYAEAIAARFSGPGQPFEGLAEMRGGKPRWTGKVAFAEHLLTLPLRWRRPRRIFVNSMSDLFHEDVQDAWVDRVFAVMALAAHHTFQVLTKRAGRMRQYLSDPNVHERVTRAAIDLTPSSLKDSGHAKVKVVGVTCYPAGPWPLPNVWLGISAEDQRRADERVPDLLATPAAVRFVSAEPLLAPINLRRVGERAQDALSTRTETRHGWARHPRVDWIIVGGESGPNARSLWTPDVRFIVRQCQAAGVPVFVKQLGADVRDRNDAGFGGIEQHEWPDVDPDEVEHDLDGTSDGYQGAPVRIHLRRRKGADPSEWPEDLRVREMPHA